MTQQLKAVEGFSQTLRASTQSAHTDAERSPLMRELFTGSLSRQRYAGLIAQLHGIYSVLEEAAPLMADDPVAGHFCFPELNRLPALESDLQYLLGDDWRQRTSLTAAATAYIQQLQRVCFDWPAGFIAHQYVRYLGDLSGGQIIARIVKRFYDLEPGAGADFYAFPTITQPDVFKTHYRSLLDSAPWDDREQQRIIDEVQLAYVLNRRLFDSL